MDSSDDDPEEELPEPPPPPPGMPMLMRLSDEETRDLKLQRALEDFYSTNLVSFDQHVNNFALDHAHELYVGVGSEEHSLRQHELFEQFVQIIDEALEMFLAEQQSSTEELYSYASAAAERGQPWPCAEYLGAAADFESFLELMQNAAKMQGWTVNQIN